MAFPVELSARITALVPSDGCQAVIVPSSLAKMNRSPMNALDAARLNTWPIGADGGMPPAGGGIVTSRDAFVLFGSVSSYTCDVPWPFADTQAKPAVGLNARPQAFSRCGSCVR